jgi:molecular chaperone GrpE
MRERSTNPRTHHRGAGGDWPGHPQDGPNPYTPDPATQGGTAADAAAEAEVERLTAQLETAKALAAEHLAALQRTAADFANFRRRTGEDRERDLGLASEALLLKVLMVADDFDRALDAMPAELKGVSWIEGIVLLDRKLRALLESEGVTPIEVIGKPFDPREHEAVASIAAPDRPDGEVVAEIQRGYRVRERVLRPALVAVATGGNTGGAPGGGAPLHTN